jgi:arsenical pump membrane protein
VPLVAAVAVLVATVVCVLLRPGGVSEAWSAAGGAAVALLLGLARPADVLVGVHDLWEVLLFLVTAMALAGLAEQAGVFAWAAGWALRSCLGRGWLLFVNLYILGALVTLFLSLDVTAVVLTPLVCALVVPLRLDGRPFVVAVAVVANAASLALPVSNLTNMLVYQLLGVGFWDFVRFLALPNLVALAVGLGVLLALYWSRLPGRLRLTLPRTRRPGRPFFRLSLALLLLAVAGFLVAGATGFPFWAVSLPAALLLGGVALWRRWVRPRTLVRTVAWGLPPFVLGMSVVVAAVARQLAPALAGLPDRLSDLPGPLVLAAAVATATVGANAVNNLPFALGAVQGLRAVPAGAVAADGAALRPALAFGLLLGVNLGPLLTVTGSLATMLCLSGARRAGVNVPALAFVGAGLLVTPPMLLAAGLTLALLLRP